MVAQDALAGHPFCDHGRRTLVTATRLYVNLAVTSAEEVPAVPVDGVGLLRAEFLLADALDGTHLAIMAHRHTTARAITAQDPANSRPPRRPQLNSYPSSMLPAAAK